jgi:cytochrome c biogenesis factor
LTLIGELSLVAALLLSAWSTIISYAGGALRREEFVESGVRGLAATFLMAGLASIGLWTALLTRDFSVEYVAASISQTTPRPYVFTAFWSGQAGAMLFCATVLSLGGTIAIAASRRRSRELVPWATGTLSSILLFLLATICFAANPFARTDVTPLDGRGMNPLLLNPAMALHQPMLYLGYVAAALPFAFAIAALLARRLDTEWGGLVVARQWMVVSWFFLTIAIVLGMRWEYLKPRGGGNWALNAVENWSVFPWLTMTASLHSVFAETKRHRKWSIVLFAASFLLSVLAVVITRGGPTDNEATSAQSPIRTWFSAFFFLTTGMTAYLIGTRLRDLQPTMSGEPVGRDRRRVGEHIVHAGLVLSLVALAGLPFRREYDARLKTGESYEATDPYGHVWRFVSQGVSQFDRPDHIVAILALDAYRDGKRVGLITSERRTYRDLQGNQLFPPSVEVGIHSTAGLDTYVTPADIRREQGSDIAKLQVAFNPLVVWVWIGGLVMTVGGLVIMWPHRARRDTHAEYVVV